MPRPNPAVTRTLTPRPLGVLTNPYSITYAKRPAKHCLPRALRSKRGMKSLKAGRKTPKTEAAEQAGAK